MVSDDLVSTVRLARFWSQFGNQGLYFLTSLTGAVNSSYTAANRDQWLKNLVQNSESEALVFAYGKLKGIHRALRASEIKSMAHEIILFELAQASGLVGQFEPVGRNRWRDDSGAQYIQDVAPLNTHFSGLDALAMLAPLSFFCGAETISAAQIT